MKGNPSLNWRVNFRSLNYKRGVYKYIFVCVTVYEFGTVKKKINKEKNGNSLNKTN